MTQKDWDKIADAQFEALDQEWRKDWSTLRERVNRRQ